MPLLPICVGASLPLGFVSVSAVPCYPLLSLSLPNCRSPNWLNPHLKSSLLSWHQEAVWQGTLYSLVFIFSFGSSLLFSFELFCKLFRGMKDSV